MMCVFLRAAPAVSSGAAETDLCCRIWSQNATHTFWMRTEECWLLKWSSSSIGRAAQPYSQQQQKKRPRWTQMPWLRCLSATRNCQQKFFSLFGRPITDGVVSSHAERSKTPVRKKPPKTGFSGREIRLLLIFWRRFRPCALYWRQRIPSRLLAGFISQSEKVNKAEK